MNNYNIYDENYTNTDSYQKFLEGNPGSGTLRIKASAASEAIPISGLKIVVSKEIDNDTIIFFEGYTDESGLIERISLPTPSVNPDNLDVPIKTTYDINASYIQDNFKEVYHVNMYANILVIQNINLVPDMTLEVSDIDGD